MNCVQAINKLLGYGRGYKLSCPNLKDPNPEKEKKLQTNLRPGITLIVWSSVDGYGPRPKGADAIKALLITKNGGRIWKFTDVHRYGNTQTFPGRFRSRLAIAKQLAESVPNCKAHNSPMNLWVGKNDQLVAKCSRSGCNQDHKLSPSLSQTVKNFTPEAYWKEKTLT